MKIAHAFAVLGLVASLCCLLGTPARATGSGLTRQESYTLRMEATYFAHGGYNVYADGTLTLHALHGSYVLTYPVWNGRLSATYRKWQRYILQQRLAYEMRLLSEETIAGGGRCVDSFNNRAAICTGSGVVVVDRTDLILDSILPVR